MFKCLISYIITILLIVIAALCGRLFSVKTISGGSQLDNYETVLQKYNHLMDLYKGKVIKPIIKVSDIPSDIILRRTTKFEIKTTATHIGQRKLFLNELQFLTNYVDFTKKTIVVYAGAAPSNKLGFLSDLCPNVIFILVDPNPFKIFGRHPIYIARTGDIKSRADTKKVLDSIDYKEQIYIINDFFTVDTAREMADRWKDGFYFISDIRSSMIRDNIPEDLDIVWNSSMQYNWIKIMKPIKSMLKWRHPYHEHTYEQLVEQTNKEPYKSDLKMSKEFGIDFLEDYKRGEINYLDGDEYIQPWPGGASTEVRLVCGPTTNKNWGHYTDYENILFTYNKVFRTNVPHTNENSNRKLGFDLCNDCAIENVIFSDYVKKAKAAKLKSYTVLELNKRLTNATGNRHLIREGHGQFFGNNQPSVEKPTK